MGAEMCVLGCGSRGMVQRMWFRGCGSGVMLYLVALYGVWFRSCGSRVLVKRLGLDLDLLSLRSNGHGSSIHAYVCRMSAWLLQFFSQNGILWLRTVFQDTFRKMYALSSYVEALTPMPEDGGTGLPCTAGIKGLFGLTYLGVMGAEMCVLGYGSRGAPRPPRWQ
nr:glycosyl transferase, family 1 [Tanacetum cinerariifolium]